VIGDLGAVIDMDAIRGAGVRMAVDPLGGAGVHYWAPIAERYGLKLTVVSETVDPTRLLMGDLDRLTQGLVLLEAVDRLTPDREPVPHLYRMLVGALRTLAAQPSELVVPAFFWKVLDAEGVRPELERCVRCGAEDPLVAFDLDEGGCSAAPAARASPSRPGRRGPAADPGRRAQPLRSPRRPPWPATVVAILATRAMEHHLEAGPQGRSPCSSRH
jgi:hypothetical protein